MITIRPFESGDAKALLALFRTTVRKVNSADYNAAQIAAWASDEISLDDWRQRFRGKFAVVAIAGAELAGFADMTDQGYLDRLFVAASFQRRGVATALFASLKAHAVEQQLPEISTAASITARPFFEAAGFEMVCQQIVACRGAEFVNYKMRLPLQLG